ncbi:hypothetical protein AB0L47_36325 [Streptomyces bobili]|uniref:hypothetical protein n=1 Tax=Streptomyces bobili TaxID=67280 RepID=UPI0034467076
MTFFESGKFEAEMLCEDSGKRFGSWRIYTPSSTAEPDGASQLKLEYEADYGFVDQFEAGGTDHRVVLWGAIGGMGDASYCFLSKG